MQNNLGAPVVFDKERDGYRYDRVNGPYELPGLWFNARELQALVTIQRLSRSWGVDFSRTISWHWVDAFRN